MYSDKEIERLLAQGRLSGPDKERILGRVLKPATSKESQPRIWVHRWAIALAASGAGIALVIGLVLGLGSKTETDSEFRSRGMASSKVVIEVGCRHGGEVSESQCSPGDRFLMRVDGLDQEAYVAAFAKGPQGEQHWYFPNENGIMPKIGPVTSPELVNQAVVIGNDHTPGSYRVVVLLFAKPVEKSAVLSSEPLAGMTFDIEVNP